MLALHSLTAQGLESARVLIVLFVIFVVAFWKIILQLLIIIAAAIVLVGAVTVFGALHIL
jgi:hypothetical protein